MKCTDPNLLLLKATSQATLLCLDQCLGVLRTQHMSAPHHHPSTPVTSVRYDTTWTHPSHAFHVGQSLCDLMYKFSSKFGVDFCTYIFKFGTVEVVVSVVFHCVAMYGI